MTRFAPLALLLALLAVMALGLTRDPRELPSALIDRPAPEFRLPGVEAGQPAIASRDLLGTPWLLNVWASWCVACAQEHDVLFTLGTRAVLVGLNHKDERAPAAQWLAQRGNPYHATAFDPQGRVALDFGVYGVPETFVIDHRGRVRHRHVGALSAQRVQRELMPLLARIEAEMKEEGVQ